MRGEAATELSHHCLFPFQYSVWTLTLCVHIKTFERGAERWFLHNSWNSHLSLLVSEHAERVCYSYRIHESVLIVTACQVWKSVHFQVLHGSKSVFHITPWNVTKAEPRGGWAWRPCCCTSLLFALKVMIYWCTYGRLDTDLCICNGGEG